MIFISTSIYGFVVMPIFDHLFFAENPPKLKISWDNSTIKAYSQCIDKVQVLYSNGEVNDEDTKILCENDSDDKDICTLNKYQNLCGDNKGLKVWISVINEGHKDGVQHIYAPTLLQISPFSCPSAILQREVKGEVANSESCKALNPEWFKQFVPEIAFPVGSRGSVQKPLGYMRAKIPNGTF